MSLVVIAVLILIAIIVVAIRVIVVKSIMSRAPRCEVCDAKMVVERKDVLPSGRRRKMWGCPDGHASSAIDFT